MEKRLMVFWEELERHAKLHETSEFIYTLEYWGILWTPSFIYMNGQALSFSIDNDHLNRDLDCLVAKGLIVLIEELPLDNIDLEKRLYRML